MYEGHGVGIVLVGEAPSGRNDERAPANRERIPGAVASVYGVNWVCGLIEVVASYSLYSQKNI
jgi:hypothetical protein